MKHLTQDTPRKKPRGRAFGKGADNPAKYQSPKPKFDLNSLAIPRYDDAEFKGVSEIDDQACSMEEEDCPSARVELENYKDFLSSK